MQEKDGNTNPNTGGDQNADGNNTNNIDPEALASAVNTQVSGEIAKQFESFTDKFSKKEEPIEEDDEDLGDDEDFLTKAELKAWGKRIEDKIGGLVEKKTNEVINEHSNKSNRDVEAYRQFPMLNQTTKAYDAEFRSAVMKEYDRRVAAGRDAKDPDLVYDSAAAVYVSDPKWQKKKTAWIQEEHDRQQAGAANFQGSTRGRDNSVGALTKRQNEISKTLGLSPERVKELNEKYRN